MEEIEKLKDALKESEAARSYIGKKLAAAQKELHEVKSELGKYRRAKKSGRLVMLPEVSEKDRKLFADGLHDYAPISGRSSMGRYMIRARQQHSATSGSMGDSGSFTGQMMAGTSW